MRKLKRAVWPHCVVLNLEGRDTAVLTQLGHWLREHSLESTSVSWGNQLACYFKQETDAVFFALRWA